MLARKRQKWTNKSVSGTRKLIADVVEGTEIKRKKSRVVGFLLKEFLAAPTQLKFVKITSYFEDVVTFSDFKQIFAEPEVRKLVISVVVRASTHSCLKGEFPGNRRTGRLSPPTLPAPAPLVQLPPQLAQIQIAQTNSVWAFGAAATGVEVREWRFPSELLPESFFFGQLTNTH